MHLLQCIRRRHGDRRPDNLLHRHFLFAAAALLMLWGSASWVFAQGPSEDLTHLQKIRTQNVDSLHAGMMVYYSPGYRERAERLGPMMEEAIQFYTDSLGIGLDFRLALLTEEAWEQVTPYPYGLPYVSSGGAHPVAVLPASGGGVVYEHYLSFEDRLPADARARLAALGLTWEEMVREVIDLIGFHEVGHAYSRAYEIRPPTKWVNELLASYFAYAFMRERPEMAAVWELIGDVDLAVYTPEHHTLEDFERLYAGVGVPDFAWYQSVFETHANALVEERGLRFLDEVKEAFATTEPGTLSNEQVLERLEQIAPGFQQWARVFDDPETLRHSAPSTTEDPMHIYVELWNARPAWHALSQEERAAFVEKVGQNVQALAERGIEPLYFAIADEEVPYRAEYDYIALWKMPDEEAARVLERDVQASGWHEYFEQVNARGEIVPPEQVFADMIGG